jgi:vacuolar protein sorting-associated protein 54
VSDLGNRQSVKWDAPKPGEGANDYMELLVKETVTLHKVLSRYLATPIVEVRFFHKWSADVHILLLVRHDTGLCCYQP